MTQLNESLHAGDFEHLIRPQFSIDEFKSKLGADEDVVTVKLEVLDRAAAQDLVLFLEKGYSFIIDADVAGSKIAGAYLVFVEIRRNAEFPKNLTRLVYGLSRLSSIAQFTFTYYKDTEAHTASQDVIEQVVPLTVSDYKNNIARIRALESMVNAAHVKPRVRKVKRTPEGNTMSKLAGLQ